MKKTTEKRLSLLAGRNLSPLSEDDVRRVINTFLGLGSAINTVHEVRRRTVFRVQRDKDTGELYGEIVFGPDVYPGQNVIDPNSALSMEAACAHELTHYHRWHDKIELTDDSLEDLDEALTSLQAINLFDRHLREHDVRQLVSDAIQRLQRFVKGLEKGKKAKKEEKIE